MGVSPLYLAAFHSSLIGKLAALSTEFDTCDDNDDDNDCNDDDNDDNDDDHINGGHISDDFTYDHFNDDHISDADH
jgi:hypothetical protein